jgi:hypothetical protein
VIALASLLVQGALAAGSGSGGKLPRPAPRSLAPTPTASAKPTAECIGEGILGEQGRVAMTADGRYAFFLAVLPQQGKNRRALIRADLRDRALIPILGVNSSINGFLVLNDPEQAEPALISVVSLESGSSDCTSGAGYLTQVMLGVGAKEPLKFEGEYALLTMDRQRQAVFDRKRRGFVEFDSATTQSRTRAVPIAGLRTIYYGTVTNLALSYLKPDTVELYDSAAKKSLQQVVLGQNVRLLEAGSWYGLVSAGKTLSIKPFAKAFNTFGAIEIPLDAPLTVDDVQIAFHPQSKTLAYDAALPASQRNLPGTRIQQKRQKWLVDRTNKEIVSLLAISPNAEAALVFLEEEGRLSRLRVLQLKSGKVFDLRPPKS